MGLAAIVLRNQLFYIRKTLPVMLICGLIILIPTASIVLVNHIRTLADRPLSDLNTELILQHNQGNKKAKDIRTKGLIEPFNMHSFKEQETRQQLAEIKGINDFSTALVLWQIDPQNSLTVVGLEMNDPEIGLRKIESLLTKGSQFFSNNSANEIILERHFSKLFGYKPGTFFTLAGQKLKIVGLVDFKEQSNLSSAGLFLPYETALKLSGKNERIINQVFLSLTAVADMDQVRQGIEQLFPNFSLISRDSLYKNLSAFNQLIYKGGYFMILAVIPIALFLLIWTLKIYRLEFVSQRDVLKVLGWPKADLKWWLVYDLGYLLIGATVVSSLLTASIYWGLLPFLNIEPLLDQSFKL